MNGLTFLLKKRQKGENEKLWGCENEKSELTFFFSGK